MKETIVYFGPRRAADYWARSKGINPRELVLATNPDALRGRTGSVRKVFMLGWYMELSPGARLRAGTSLRHIDIITESGGKASEEWD